jgi:hypothetical protein
MIYHHPAPDEAIVQGDLIDDCPIVPVSTFQPDQPQTATVVGRKRPNKRTGLDFQSSPVLFFGRTLRHRYSTLQQS